jgi:DNA-binding transcriptional ArsR family regulator
MIADENESRENDAKEARGSVGSLGKALQRAVGVPGQQEARPGRGRSSALMNSARQELLMYLSRNPCSHMRAIARGLGWSMPTVDWHMRKMMGAGIVQEKRVGRKRIFYITGQVSSEDQRACTHLSQEIPRRLLKAVAATPGLTQGELAGKLKQRDIGRHLKTLVALGLLAEMRDGRFKRYFLDPAVMDRDRCYQKQAKTFKKDILRMLRTDGLDAWVMTARDGLLEIDISVGRSKRTIILHVTPFAALMSGR